MTDPKPTMPRARKEDLVVEELPDETLVYDLKRHKAHCLNRTAALVWRHSDGQTSLAEMAGILEAEAELPPDEGIVLFALNRLRKAKLLEDETTMPSVAVGHSRRELVKRLTFGGLAILLPTVTSMVAPAAAMQASSTTKKACRNGCVGLGLPCSNKPGTTCTWIAKKSRCRCR